jgi:hypothetical protein
MLQNATAIPLLAFPSVLRESSKEAKQLKEACMATVQMCR